MAKKVRLEFIDEGFKQILNSSAVKNLVESTGNDLAARAGPGFESTPLALTLGGSPRPGAVVKTTDDESRLAEAEYKALSIAAGAG